MSNLVGLVNEFFPYAQKQMGFNRPVSLFLASDEENSMNPLGKTGFYNPASAEITVFVDGRHPKDILRSISHELVHHAQNCRGEFDGELETGDNYAQIDPHLREMERQAYELGNLCFRDWENTREEPSCSENKNMTLKQTTFKDIVEEVLGEDANLLLELDPYFAGGAPVPAERYPAPEEEPEPEPDLTPIEDFWSGLKRPSSILAKTTGLGDAHSERAREEAQRELENKAGSTEYWGYKEPEGSPEADEQTIPDSGTDTSKDVDYGDIDYPGKDRGFWGSSAWRAPTIYGGEGVRGYRDDGVDWFGDHQSMEDANWLEKLIVSPITLAQMAMHGLGAGPETRPLSQGLEDIKKMQDAEKDFKADLELPSFETLPAEVRSAFEDYGVSEEDYNTVRDPFPKKITPGMEFAKTFGSGINRDIYAAQDRYNRRRKALAPLVKQAIAKARQNVPKGLTPDEERRWEENFGWLPTEGPGSRILDPETGRGTSQQEVDQAMYDASQEPERERKATGIERPKEWPLVYEDEFGNLYSGDPGVRDWVKQYGSWPPFLRSQWMSGPSIQNPQQGQAAGELGPSIRYGTSVPRVEDPVYDEYGRLVSPEQRYEEFPPDYIYGAEAPFIPDVAQALSQKGQWGTSWEDVAPKMAAGREWPELIKRIQGGLGRTGRRPAERIRESLEKRKVETNNEDELLNEIKVLLKVEGHKVGDQINSEVPEKETVSESKEEFDIVEESNSNLSNKEWWEDSLFETLTKNYTKR